MRAEVGRFQCAAVQQGSNNTMLVSRPNHFREDKTFVLTCYEHDQGNQSVRDQWDQTQKKADQGIVHRLDVARIHLA